MVKQKSESSRFSIKFSVEFVGIKELGEKICVINNKME